LFEEGLIWKWRNRGKSELCLDRSFELVVLCIYRQALAAVKF